MDDSEAKKEASEWERRRARVTAALVPGLKKCLAAPLGSGRQHGVAESTSPQKISDLSERQRNQRKKQGVLIQWSDGSHSSLRTSNSLLCLFVGCNF